jgi:hypothetical protein
MLVGFLAASIALVWGGVAAAGEPPVELPPIEYDPDPPDGFVPEPLEMGEPIMHQPAGGEIWGARTEHMLTCSPPYDSDTKYENCDSTSETDHVTVWWECDGLGEFKLPNYTDELFPFGYLGTDVTWITPDAPGPVEIQCFADDNYLDYATDVKYQFGPEEDDWYYVSREYADLCIADDYGTSADPVTVHIVKLVVVDVPDSYYADSASWVPFRFAVVGSPGNVAITAGTIEFYIGEEQKFEEGLLVKPFKPSNGTGQEYLAVINESAFDAVSTLGAVAEDARIKLSGVSGQVGTTGFGPLDSQFSSDMKLGDDTIEIVEFGEDESFHFRKAKTRQDHVDHAGVLSAMAMKATWGGEPCPRPVAPIEQTLLYGFDEYWPGAPSGVAGSYTQRCMLSDDLDATGVGGGNTVEVRWFNRQSGVYLVGFRNQVAADAPGNPFGVPVVGIVSNHSGSIVLFQGGTVTANISEFDAYASSTLTRAFNFAKGSLDDLVFVCPPAGAVLSAAMNFVTELQKVSKAVSVIEEDNYSDMAEVVAYGVIDLANGVNRPSPSNAETILREWTETSSPAVPLNIGDPSVDIYVNNTYRLYLETDVNVRAMSRYSGSITVDAKLDVTLGDEKLDVAWPTLPPELVNGIMCDAE